MDTTDTIDLGDEYEWLDLNSAAFHTFSQLPETKLFQDIELTSLDSPNHIESKMEISTPLCSNATPTSKKKVTQNSCATQGLMTGDSFQGGSYTPALLGMETTVPPSITRKVASKLNPVDGFPFISPNEESNEKNVLGREIVIPANSPENIFLNRTRSNPRMGISSIVHEHIAPPCASNEPLSGGSKSEENNSPSLLHATALIMQRNLQESNKLLLQIELHYERVLKMSTDFHLQPPKSGLLHTLSESHETERAQEKAEMNKLKHHPQVTNIRKDRPSLKKPFWNGKRTRSKNLAPNHMDITPNDRDEGESDYCSPYVWRRDR